VEGLTEIRLKIIIDAYFSTGNPVFLQRVYSWYDYFKIFGKSLLILNGIL